MTGQLRHLCDLLLADANACGAGGSVASQSQPQASPQSSFSRLIEALAELLFRRAIVPIDRFLLTLLLRNYEGSDSNSTLSLPGLLSSQFSCYSAVNLLHVLCALDFV